MTATATKTDTAIPAVPAKLSRGQKVAADLSALIRARNPFIWIKTNEEARVEGYVAQAASAASFTVRAWDCVQGVTKLDGKKENVGSSDINETLTEIRKRAETGSDRGIWVLRDLPPWLAAGIGINTVRALRNLARYLPGCPTPRAQSIVVITPSGEIPPELAGHVTVIDWPLPDRTEIGDILDAAIAPLAQVSPEKAAAALPEGTRDAAIDAAVGLNSEEAAACFAKSLVQHKRIDPAAVGAEKRRIVAREKVLEWHDPLPGGLDSVGGLELLKAWLLQRTTAFSPKAKAYGLPVPKGVLIVGMSGCGKTLTAKAFSAALNCPLVRADLNALKGKYMGQSEANLRKLFTVVEALGRCVLWIDELEKALEGAASGGGASDGGVAADALGAILSWMQERTCEAFIIATANDVSKLPPELLRKGRFDEIFFVDLPTQSEREAIVSVTLKQFGRGDVKIDRAKVAQACDQFTGAEIASVIPEAMFTAFSADAREITTADLIEAAGRITPLSQTAAEKIKASREWGEKRARRASPKEEAAFTPQARGRQIEVEA